MEKSRINPISDKQREKIMEEIRNILTRFGDFMGGDPAVDDVLDIDEALDAILSYLDKEDVVLKVEGKLPSIFDANEDVISAREYKKKLGGFVAVEPLIGGNNGI